MIKKAKKMISVVLVLALTLMCTVTTFAAEKEDEEASQVNVDGLREDQIKMLLDIPIFVSYIYEWDENNISTIEEKINQKITEAYDRDDLSFIEQNQSDYEIVEIKKEEKRKVLLRPEFANVYTRVIELLKQDATVKYVNHFLPSSAKAASSGNANDPSYWESNCPKLCPSGGSNVYSGYKFLYMESSVSVETSRKVAGNISGMNWTSIVAKTTKLAADIFVENVYYRTASVAYDALSAVFSGYTAPYSVTYSASSGYLKTWVSGDLYMRTILISDNLNRVSGYAYYDWGHLESFKAKTKVDAKWPTTRRAGGTYNYETNTYTYPNWRITNTPGFYGNTTLYSNVVSLYRNTIGYFKHDEMIDINSVIASLI